MRERERERAQTCIQFALQSIRTPSQKSQSTIITLLLTDFLTDATLASLIWMEKYRCKLPLLYMVNGFTYKNVTFSAFYMTNLHLWHTCTDKHKQKGG